MGYRNLIPPLAREYRGTRDARSGRSARSSLGRSGQSASFLINMGGPGIGRFLTLPSTVSFAAAP